MSVAPASTAQQPVVLCLGEVDLNAVRALLTRFTLELQLIARHENIPGSYWGESEAGLVGHVIYARLDTPLHSLLHEACHFICMDGARRADVHRDAGGDYDEENAVCYLQILLADHVPGFDRVSMFADMDAWGYTFRLGSARAWFEQDAAGARAWLMQAGLIDKAEQSMWCVRR